MKVIDLLNRIANDEEVPEKIKYNNETFTIREEKDDYANQNCWFTDRFSLLDLNEEVEIIEEDKKIEHIEHLEDSTYFENMKIDTKFDYLYEMTTRILIKVNEIIDKINEE